jgi:hypothetical protein
MKGHHAGSKRQRVDDPLLVTRAGSAAFLAIFTHKPIAVMVLQKLSVISQMALFRAYPKLRLIGWRIHDQFRERLVQVLTVQTGGDRDLALRLVDIPCHSKSVMHGLWVLVALVITDQPLKKKDLPVPVSFFEFSSHQRHVLLLLKKECPEHLTVSSTGGSNSFRYDMLTELPVWKGALRGVDVESQRLGTMSVEQVLKELPLPAYRNIYSSTRLRVQNPHYVLAGLFYRMTLDGTSLMSPERFNDPRMLNFISSVFYNQSGRSNQIVLENPWITLLCTPIAHDASKLGEWQKTVGVPLQERFRRAFGRNWE